MRILVLFFLLNLTNLFAQNDTAIVRTFGGDGEDFGLGMVETYDKGFALIGYTSSYNSNLSDIYLVKVDSNCNYLWSKKLGGSEVDQGHSIIETGNKELLICGFSNSYGNSYQGILIKTDSLGNVLWEKNYGSSSWDFLYNVIHLPNNEYLLTGTSYNDLFGTSDMYLIKVDSNGNIIWERYFGGNKDDSGSKSVLINDSIIATIGSKMDEITNKKDFYLIKVNVSGNLVFEETYGGNEDDYGLGIDKTVDKGVLLVGESSSFGENDKDVLLYEIDSVNTKKWEYTISETLNDNTNEIGRAIKQLPDKSLIFVGYSYFGLGDRGMYILKFNSGLVYEAGPTFGDIDFDDGYDLLLSTKNEMLFIGNSRSYSSMKTDVYLVKIPNYNLTNDYTLDVISYNDISLNINQNKHKNQISLFPNPTTSHLILPENVTSANLYNISGQKVKSINDLDKIIDVKDLKTGFYLLELILNDNTIKYSKILKQ